MEPRDANPSVINDPTRESLPCLIAVDRDRTCIERDAADRSIAFPFRNAGYEITGRERVRLSAFRSIDGAGSAREQSEIFDETETAAGQLIYFIVSRSNE